jgi:hypothetical protein
LAEPARARIATLKVRVQNQLAAQREHHQRITDAIASNRTMSGPRVGQPYSEKGLKRARIALAARGEVIARCEWVQRKLLPWAQVHPVEFVLGELPDWANEQLRSGGRGAR